MRERGSVKAWVLAFVLLAAGGLGTLVGVGCLISANSCPFRSEPPQTSRDGAQLFLANCAACHGSSGEGRSGPSLVTGPAASLEATELFSKIARGKPLAGMPRFERTLDRDQITAVRDHVLRLRGDEPPPSASPTPTEAPS